MPSNPEGQPDVVTPHDRELSTAHCSVGSAGSRAFATASFLVRGRSVIDRINVDRIRQTPLVITIGHSFLISPKVSQSANPNTVIAYIGAEMPAVSRLLMIFQACGAKLVVEQTAAREPMIVSNSIQC